MTKKATDGYAELMKAFDPANISKLFDPQKMMEQFGAKPSDFDLKEIIKKTEGNFDAMTKANEAAAASYRDLLERQMQIFKDVTAEATAHIHSAPPEDAQAAYQKAVKRALEIMTELSDNAHKANNEAYKAVRSQVDKAIKDLKT